MTHQDALNVILAHNCPNGNEPDAEQTSIYSWVLEGHCNTIKIRAKLVEKNQDHPIKEERYKYDILSVTVE